MKYRVIWFGVLTMLACLSNGSLTLAQTALDGQNLSALSPENLAKPRPAAPFDMTGTWNMIIDPATGMHEFSPLPELTTAASEALALTREWEEKGYEYRDDPGACWPLGMPRTMTRFWPISNIQLPTMIQQTAMFNNSIRWIYTDERSHPSEEDLVYTYNGHSIGWWEGDILVVDTVGMTDDHHWIQAGIPAGLDLHIVERYRMVGDELQIEFTMTDPGNWEGEWVNTKRFLREDRADIEEHVCILEQMQFMPSFKYNIRE
ncbi:hypothetical protein JYU22_03540 [Gammaproteobacteria bacterium AH-315-E17]|nr:hypothetical protein [Gammaproteobacteria bacterium AH-315-E17]